MDDKENLELIQLLQAEYDDDINHRLLHRIREIQAPRFDAVKDRSPDIMRTFLEARSIHDRLYESRKARIARLQQMIDRPIVASYLIEIDGDVNKFLKRKNLKRGESITTVTSGNPASTFTRATKEEEAIFRPKVKHRKRSKT